MNALEEHVANLFAEPDEEPKEAPVEEEPKEAPVEEEPKETPVEEPVEEEPVEEEPVEEEPVDWSKVAQARLREINALRTRTSTLKEEMQAIREEMKALKATLTPEEGIPEEMLEADPALRFVTRKLESIEGQIKTSKQEQEEAAKFTLEQQEVVRYAQDSMRDFTRHTPDWQDAYGFLRQRYAEASGIANDPNREAILNLSEHEAVRAWMESGEDPALKIYELAKQNGWKSGQKVRQSNNNGRIRRVKEAVAAPSVNSIGNRDMGQDVISREEFYTRYPQSERVRIFNSQNGEDIFEVLMKDGKVPLSMINGSPR